MLLAAGGCWLVADGCLLLPLAAGCCYYPNEPYETGDGRQRQSGDGGRQTLDGRAPAASPDGGAETAERGVPAESPVPSPQSPVP
jgi:hypothetical protein